MGEHVNTVVLLKSNKGAIRNTMIADKMYFQSESDYKRTVDAWRKKRPVFDRMSNIASR